MNSWVIPMLGERICCMEFGTLHSGVFIVSSGLLQGSPLRSVLFNIYTADIVSSLVTPTTVGYAHVDDITVE
jgi:hypothetical protein